MLAEGSLSELAAIPTVFSISIIFKQEFQGGEEVK